MSKLELINKPIKNAKINQLQLKKICELFTYDFTASQTAQKLGLSRQTINSYYKIIRDFLIKDFDYLNELILNNRFDKLSYKLKYIKLKTTTIYYLEINNTPYLLNDEESNFKGLNCFVNNNLKKTLLNHKKANCAKILYSTYQNEFFVANYTRCEDEIGEFVNTRLKKFRGVNKNNLSTHIKESFIRYSYDKNELLKILQKNFNF